MLLSVSLLYPLGFPQPDGGTAAWWITRPLWILVGVIPLVAIVALMGRFERPPPTRFRAKSHASAVIASIGTALLAIGISGIATGTLGNLLHGTSRLVLIDITPFQAMTIAATGWLLLRSSVIQEPEVERRVTSTPLPGA